MCTQGTLHLLLHDIGTHGVCALRVHLFQSQTFFAGCAVYDLCCGCTLHLCRGRYVTLINFSLSKHLIREDELLTDQCGSLAYVSPEVLSGKFYVQWTFFIKETSSKVRNYRMIFGLNSTRVNHCFEYESKRSLVTSLKKLIQSSDVSACFPDLPQGDIKFN